MARRYKKKLRRRYNKFMYNRKPKRKRMTYPNVWFGKHVGQIVPDKLMVKLCYYDQSFTINNSGLGFANLRYVINSVYDPDPISLSNGILGYSQLAAIYNSYRVHAIKYDIDFVNRDNDVVPTVYVAPLPAWTIDPGQNTTDNNNYIMTAYAKSKGLGVSGGMDRCKLKGYISMRKLFGSDQVKYSGDFASAINNSPALKGYMVVGAYCSNNDTFTAGISGEIRIIYYTEFYNRKQINITPDPV